MFRFKRGIDVGYVQQGYIYFFSRMYYKLPESEGRKILNLCMECGGEHYRALFEYVTSDSGAVAVCMKHYISQATLFRLVKRYYERFAEEMGGRA